MSQLLSQGAGIGLRSIHYAHILETLPKVPWFEVLTENYMGEGGMPIYYLEKIRQEYPITFHGVGMSLGSADPLNMQYMKKLKTMIERYQPQQVSDHLSWISVNQQYAHELLPFPYNDQTLQHLCDKISAAQDYLGQYLLVENPSSYMCFKQSDTSEWEFINQLLQRTGCKLLLDVNNIYVSAYNTGLDALKYIQLIDKESIAEVHLAGFEDRGTHYYDTHGSTIHADVWKLYQQLIDFSGPKATLVEWDTDIPDFNVLQEEAGKAQKIINGYVYKSSLKQVANL